MSGLVQAAWPTWTGDIRGPFCPGCGKHLCDHRQPERCLDAWAAATVMGAEILVLGADFDAEVGRDVCWECAYEQTGGFGGNPHVEPTPAEFAHRHDAGLDYCQRPPGGDRVRVVPRYSSSVDAAFKLAEKLAEGGRGYSLRLVDTGAGQGAACFHKMIGMPDLLTAPLHHHSVGYAATAAHALVEAAIATIIWEEWKGNGRPGR